MYNLFSFLCGLLFGLGLTISNMVNPNKVLNFLDIFGTWDPTLLVVMAAALVVTAMGYHWVIRLKKPQCDTKFHLPTQTRIDKNLVLGSIIFGIGWGVAGYCPGPGITALSTFNSDPLYFVIGLIIGSFAFWALFSKNK